MKNTLFKATATGLAALAMSACAPKMPELPQPTERGYLDINVGNHRWRMHNLDKDNKTYEAVQQMVTGSDNVRTVYYSPGFLEQAKELGNPTQRREMTPEMQKEFNNLANQIISFQDAANIDTYNLQLKQYNDSRKK